NFDSVTTGTATLTQTISTVAGHTYTIDFWLTNWFGSSNSFSTLWNGATIATLTNIAGTSNIYTEYTYQVVATGSSTALTFSGTQAQATGGWLLDNVSVVGVASSTETSSGQMTFTDADRSDTHTVSVAPNGNVGTFAATLGTDSTNGATGTVNWSFSVNDSDIQY